MIIRIVKENGKIASSHVESNLKDIAEKVNEMLYTLGYDLDGLLVVDYEPKGKEGAK